jgi:hypothetical protein
LRPAYFTQRFAGTNLSKFHAMGRSDRNVSLNYIRVYATVTPLARFAMRALPAIASRTSGHPTAVPSDRRLEAGRTREEHREARFPGGR